MPCQIECLTKYGCAGKQTTQALDGAVFSPYVKLEFGNGGVITMGNASAPPDNHATISSFSYGFTPNSSGFGAEFEIVDNGGVMHTRILRALNTGISTQNKDASETKFDFGWIVKETSGRTYLQTSEMLSGKKLHGIVTKIDQTYEGGSVKLKFKIEGIIHGVPDALSNEALGDEDQKITLTEALRRLFTENYPKFNSIKFRDKDGVLSDNGFFKTSDGGPSDKSNDGPMGVWPINQQNAMSAARTWLSSITTKNGRGILILYDPDSLSIVFQEDLNDKKLGMCCGLSIGTYVVNGGNCSPVISFNPSIAWPIGLLPGGGATPSGSASGANDDYIASKKNIIGERDKKQKAGSLTSPVIQQHEWMWRNPEELASKASEGNAAHLEANRDAETPTPAGFSAELKIHGNPGLGYPISLAGVSVAIIYINPFHVSDKCTWITTSSCNSYFSSKNYQVHGVSHQISGGSFVTTLKVFLPLIGRDIDSDQPFGGCAESK